MNSNYFIGLPLLAKVKSPSSFPNSANIRSIKMDNDKHNTMLVLSDYVCNLWYTKRIIASEMHYFYLIYTVFFLLYYSDIFLVRRSHILYNKNRKGG